jgi:cytochrome c oxidase subunit IV
MSNTQQHEAYAHIAPLPILIGVFLTLVVLTGVTVGVTYFDLGGWNLIVAMAIATVKAVLVVLYFMHLRYDNPFNAIVFLVAILFIALFISITLLDTTQYQPDIRQWQKANPQN